MVYVHMKTQRRGITQREVDRKIMDECVTIISTTYERDDRKQQLAMTGRKEATTQYRSPPRTYGIFILS